MMKVNVLAIAVITSLMGCGGSNDSVENDNTAGMFSGDITGSLTIGGSDISGSLMITDPDEGEDAAIEQSNVATSYGTFSINSNGQWTYSADSSNSALIALGSNASVVDTINVRSVDDESQNITITVNGVNDVAEFGTGNGVSNAAINNNLSTPVTGTLSITDLDTNEGSFIAQGATMSTYGEFSIDEDGTWSYTLNTSNTIILALDDDSAPVVDELVVSSIDGTNATISVTISGSTSVQED